MGIAKESSCGVMRVRTIIDAPQRGQCQLEAAGCASGMAVQRQSQVEEFDGTERKAIGSKAVGQEAEMADAHESLGQYVQEEAAQELDCIKCHHA